MLSFLTTVWNTPLDYLRPAVQSLLAGQTVGDFEWVVLDNGSTDPAVVRYLREAVATDRRVVFLRAEQNLGIIGGMHRVLSAASGRYVLPFDSDDLLYPDAVAILTHHLRANGHPAAMYTDEDKVDGVHPCSPYFKPDWDPVLLLNSCYVAHLGCLDRRLAIDLGVYTDARCEGCHDWDAFTRFMVAGHVPVHVPEMVYSWRIHGNSTAGNIASKAYVFDSHRAVLSRFLAASPHAGKFDLTLSPLFPGTPDWWMQRRAVDVPPIPSVVVSGNPGPAAGPLPPGLDDQPQHRAGLERVSAQADPRTLLPWLDGQAGLVCVTFDAVRLNQPVWTSEVTGLFELFPDVAMVGGRIVTPAGRITEAGRMPGFNGLYGCPDQGRAWNDPGNLAEMWKQRSVAGVSTHMCVARADFLRDVIRAFAARPISWPFLGAWAALHARRTGRRVVCSPFFVGVSDINPDVWVGQAELLAFQTESAGLLPDTRFYNRHLGRVAGQAYVPV